MRDVKDIEPCPPLPTDELISGVAQIEAYLLQQDAKTRSKGRPQRPLREEIETFYSDWLEEYDKRETERFRRRLDLQVW